jgi:hypothetical protein
MGVRKITFFITDTVYIYGAGGGNTFQAVAFYWERFPDRQVPDARMFPAVSTSLRLLLF